MMGHGGGVFNLVRGGCLGCIWGCGRDDYVKGSVVLLVVVSMGGTFELWDGRGNLLKVFTQEATLRLMTFDVLLGNYSLFLCDSEFQQPRAKSE